MDFLFKYFVEGFKWDSTNIYVILIYISAGVACLALLVLICASIIHHVKMKKIQDKMRLNTSDVRYFVYNLNNNTIRHFSKKDASIQKVTTDAAFFSSLPTLSDQEKMKGWLTDYVEDPSSTPSFITLKGRTENIKIECLSVYRIISFNKNKNILHFENILLPAILMKRKHFKKDLSFVKKLDEVEAYSRGKRGRIRECNIYYITLTQFVNGSADNASQKTLYVTSIYQPLNNIQEYLSKNRNLVLINDREAAIFDFNKAYLKADVISFCSTLIEELSKYFSLSGLKESYEITIGAARYNGTNVFMSQVDKARELSFRVMGGENATRYLIEEDESKFNNYSEKSQSESIIKAVNNETFRNYFYPVVSWEKKKTFFMVSPVVYGLDFDMGFLKLAANIVRLGCYKRFMLSVLKRVILVSNEVGKTKFFVRVPINATEDLLSIFEYNKELNPNMFVIVFDDDEIQDLFEANVSIIDSIDRIHKAGLEVSTFFRDAEVDSPDEILKKLDYFFIDANLGSNLYNDRVLLSRLISAKSALEMYKKPIVINGTNTIYDIKSCQELGYKSFMSSRLFLGSSVPYIPDDIIAQVDSFYSIDEDE